MIRRGPGLPLLALILVACQPAGPTATPGGEPGSSGAGASPSAAAVATLGPPPSPTPPDETTPVVLDPTVLEFLPASINGIDVVESIDEATEALADPALPRIASAMDAGIAVDSGTGNLVAAWVLRLRPDTFTDAIYRQFRNAYDEGRCQAAGGVVASVETTIDDRAVHITTCVQGLRTYHVWLEDSGVLISAWSVGAGKFGEILMSNLRVPA